MSGKLRAVLIIVGVLILVVLVAPFLIPVNQFRPTIEEKASAALGRQVGIGNLSLSLLTGSLSAENLSIGDDPKFSSAPFLTAKSLRVGVEMLPLIFSRAVNITGITINGPQVTLLRDASGRWNYSSLGGSSTTSTAPSSPNNAAPGGPSSQPSTSPALSIKKFALNDGSVIIGSKNTAKRSTYDHVNVTASDVSLTSKFPVSVAADLPGGGRFKLDGDVGPVDQADTSLTPLDAKLQVGSLNLASTGLLDPSLGLGGIVDLDGTLASQGGQAETRGKVKLSHALLVAGGSPAGVPVTGDFNTKYDLRKNTGVLNPTTIKIGGAAATLKGTYDMGAATTVNVKLDAKDMPAKDLEDFLPALGINLPKGASLQAGTLNTDLNFNGPVDKLVIDGTVGLFNGKLAGFDLGSKMSSISALTGVKTGKDLEIEKLTSTLRMAPEGIRADNFNAAIPSLGTLFGAGTIDAKNNLDFKMVATLATPSTGAGASGATGGTAGATTGAAGGAAGLLGGLLGKIPGATGGSAASKGLHVPFLIQGTTADPRFIPDVKGLATGMLKSQLGNVGIPGLTSSPQQQNTTNPLSGLGSLFKKKKP